MSSGELARLLRAAVPIVEMRAPDPEPTRIFGPRPPKPAVRPRHRRAMPAMWLVPLAMVAVSLRLGDATGTRDCGPVRVPNGAQVVRGDTSGRGCLSVGVYEHQVLTIRLRPDDRG